MHIYLYVYIYIYVDCIHTLKRISVRGSTVFGSSKTNKLYLFTSTRHFVLLSFVFYIIHILPTPAPHRAGSGFHDESLASGQDNDIIESETKLYRQSPI